MMEQSREQQFIAEIIRQKGIIFRICRIYQKEKSAQDDLYQDILLNAWNSFPRFEGRTKFSTWLYRVALNTALHQRRKNRIFENIVGLEHAENYSDQDSQGEQLEKLRAAINTLDTTEKSIVVLYLDELPYKEISEITGLTETNVGVRLNRIKIKLKEYFEAYGT